MLRVCGRLGGLRGFRGLGVYRGIGFRISDLGV